MSKLTDYRLLSFDVYGTLIDHETGMMKSLAPFLIKSKQCGPGMARALEIFQKLSAAQQRATPTMKYSDLLATILPELLKRLECAEPTAQEVQEFSQRVGMWPAFPDTVDALQRLQKHFKLVVLSNVDNDSFAYTNKGPLEGFKFDSVLTAQDIGSYKPDLKNFEYMFEHVKEKFGVERSEILQTAQSQFHDHQPAQKLGLKSCWIYRPSKITRDKEDPVFDWKFATLGDMADAVEKELGAE